MSARLVACAVLAMLLSAGPVVAVDFTWQGINTEAATAITQTSVDDSTLWLDATTEPPDNAAIPGATDTALFYFNDLASSGDYSRDLVVPSGATFAPLSVTLKCDNATFPSYAPIDWMKTTSLNDLNFNYTSGGTQVFRVGVSPNIWSSSVFGTAAGYAHVAYVRNNATAGLVGDFNVAGPVNNKTYTFTGMSYDQIRNAINADTATTGVKAVSAWGMVTFYSASGGAAQSVTVTSQAEATIPADGTFVNYMRRNMNGVQATGLDTAAATLTLSGTQPVTFAGARASWSSIWLAANSKLVFGGDNVEFTASLAANANCSGISKAGITGGTGSSVEITSPTAAVTLRDPGRRYVGTLGISAGPLFKVVSTQTWTADANAYIYRVPAANESVVGIIDSSTTLPNMGPVNILCEGPRSGSAKLESGTYGGFFLTGGDNWGTSSASVRLMGNVNLTGYIVQPGNDATVAALADSTYGLSLGGPGASYGSTGADRYVGANLLTNGFNLTVTNGVRLFDDHTGSAGDTETANNNGPHLLTASGSSVVTIGGDLALMSTITGGSSRVGLTGTATNVFNIGGSVSSNVRSLASAYNGLADSTVNMLGGAFELPATWEVTSNPAAATFGPGTGAIGVMNIGADADPAYIQLVNNSTNDVGAGEVLLVKTLNIKAGSTLDCVGQGVKMSSTTLSIAGDGWLDLNSGSVQSPGVPYAKVYSVGNVAAAWDPYKTRVKDSTAGNETLTFEPFYDDTVSKTFWQPKGAATGIISADSSVSVVPASIRNNGTDKATVTIVLVDTGGYAIPSKTAADFTITAGGATVNFIGESNPGVSGIYTAEVSSTVVTVETIMVTVSGTALNTTPTLNVVVPVPAKTPSTVAASRTVATDDGAVTSTFSIYLQDAFGGALAGKADDLSLLDGTTDLGVTFTELGGGNYRVVYSALGAATGAHTLRVAFDYGGADEVVLDDAADTKTITVYTAGVGGYPLADASATVTSYTDNDCDGYEVVTLDGSLSSDDVGITNYRWTYAAGGWVYPATSYNVPVNANAVVTAPLTVGTHNIVLMVWDASGNLHMNPIAITVLPRADDTSVQLDISGGFNWDAIIGPKEMRAVYYWAFKNGHIGFGSGRLDLAELQGGHAQGLAWNLISQYSGDLMPANSPGETYTYSSGTEWFHPQYLLGREGVPAEGILSGAYYVYHMASAQGNATLPGDWTEVASPQTPNHDPPFDRPTVDPWMERKNNVMATSIRGNATDVTEVQAVLPVGQQVRYSDLNVVLNAWWTDAKARNMQIVAVYTDDSEEVLYQFNTAAAEGPRSTDDGVEIEPQFRALYTYMSCYNNGSGDQGGVFTGYDTDGGNLYEFTVPLAVNPSKSLKALKIRDAGGLSTDVIRGLSIFAASAHLAPEPTGVVDADRSAVDVAPLLIPDNNETTATITVTALDVNGVGVTGLLAGDFVVTITGGGTHTVENFTEVGFGVYTFTVRTGDYGAKGISVAADGVAITDTAALEVYSAPWANAGPDQNVGEATSSYMLVTLDGSGSTTADGGGLSEYKWEEGATVLGYGATLQVALMPGVHTITLTVTDNDAPAHTDADTVTVTIAVKAYATEPIVLTAEAFNVDTFGTPAEVTAAVDWYAYWFGTDASKCQNVNSGAWNDNGTPADLSDDIWVPNYPPANQLDKSIRWAFSAAYTDTANTVMQGNPGDPNADEWYPSNDSHWQVPWVNVNHMVDENPPAAVTFRGQDGYAGAIQSVVLSGYAAYQMQPFDAGTAIEDETQGKLPASMNAIKLGIVRGSWGPLESGYAERTVMLQTPAKYSDVNFLLSGSVNDASRHAWFRVIAIYNGAPFEEEVIYESPYTIDTTFRYGPPNDETNRDNWIPRGVPSALADTTTFPYGGFNPVIVGWTHYGIGGNGYVGTWPVEYYSSPGSRAAGSFYRFWEPGAAGLAVNSSKVLVGFRFELDAGPNLWASTPGYPEGLTVQIYAVSGTPSGGPPPELVVAASTDFSWVYQNTAVTTADRHQSVLTVNITGGSVGGETYAITVGENGGAVANFQITQPVAIVAGTPQTVDVLGGRRDLSTAGSYTLNVTVTGTPGAQTATVNVPLALRLLGDIDGDGAVTASDKLEMNKNLNGLATLPGIGLRELDLTGDGATVNAEDKLVINQVLNGLIVP